MNTCPSKSKRGNITIILVIFIAVIAIVGLFLNYRSSHNVTALPTLPPVSDRVNPEPTSGYSLSLTKVDPGNTLTIDAVQMSSDGYIAVYLDGNSKTLLGKSELLSQGAHSNVSIKLSKAVVDGDVVFVDLLDKSGKIIQNESKTNIEVKMNVGHLMSHYADEY